MPLVQGLSVTLDKIASARWSLSRGPVYEVGNPSAYHYHLPIGVAVVGTSEGAADDISTYTLVESDASYGPASRVAGLSYRIGLRDPRSTVRVGVGSSVIAEMKAGLLGLVAAHAGGVRRVCLRTDNQVLAYTFAERWFPRKDSTFRMNDSIASVKQRFDALAVAHVRTKEISAVDRAARHARARYEAMAAGP